MAAQKKIKPETLKTYEVAIWYTISGTMKVYAQDEKQAEMVAALKMQNNGLNETEEGFNCKDYDYGTEGATEQ